MKLNKNNFRKKICPQLNHYFKLNKFFYHISKILVPLQIIISISAMGQVSANFIIIGDSIGCGDLTVEFQDISLGNPTSWYWDFGNGFTSNDQNPIMFFTPGIYDVKLKVSDSISSDNIIYSNSVIVYSNPIVDFSSDIFYGCNPLSVNFVEQSLLNSNIKSWYWDFGEGNYDTVQNPNNVYNIAGEFNVSLLVTDSNDCKSLITKNDFILVDDSPEINFSVQPDFSCQINEQFQFSNSTINGNQYIYKWIFGDGQTSLLPNPVHIYNNQGVFDVSLIAESSYCKDTLTINKLVSNGIFDVNFSSDDTIICSSYQNVSFQDLSSSNITDWYWDFGDGNFSFSSNPVHSYVDSGLYNVSLTVSHNGGCVTQKIKQNYILVNRNPEINFFSNDTISCQLPFLLELYDNTSNAMDWIWSVNGDSINNIQNPQFLISEKGLYDIALEVIDVNGCSNTKIKNNYIKIDWADIDFFSTSISGCSPLNVNFNNDIDTDLIITDFNWDFGNGNISSLENPSITFNDTGYYSISLTVKNEIGCVSNKIKNNYLNVSESPNSNFTISNVNICGNDSVLFTDISSSYSPIDSWYWNFGGSNYLNSTLQNPVHMFQDTGYQNISLITGVNNCYDTLSIDSLIYVNSPIALFYMVQNCSSYNEISFFNESIDYDSCLWSFGDGNYSNNTHPVHFYSNYGEYEVNLKLFNNNVSCNSSLTKTIIVEPPYPSLIVDSLTPSIGCPPLTVLFHDTSPYSDENLSSPYNVQDKIFFGDGSFSNNNYENTYLIPGYYNVTHIVGNTFGCLDTLIYDSLVHVYDLSVNIQTADVSSCKPFEVLLIDNSFSDDSIISWYWEIENGIISNDKDPFFLIQDEGFYDVKLKVSSLSGCQDSIILNDHINCNSFDFDINFSKYVCYNDSILFSSDNSDQSINYYWSFSNVINDSLWFIFDSIGIYNEYVIAVDSNLCVDTFNLEINVLKPLANFTIDNVSSNCPPLITNITDLSSNSVINWKWNFGDSILSYVQNPSHIYQESGNYSISLFIEDSIGCRDSLILNDIISISGPNGGFHISENEPCENEPIIFSPYFNNVSSILWDFGDSSFSNLDTIHYSYENAGFYIPKLILSNQNGCHKLILGDTIFVDSNTIYLNHNNNYTICKNDSVQINLISNGSVLSWFPNIHISDTLSLSTFIYPDTSTKYIVTLQDGFCTNFDSINIKVNQNPRPPNLFFSSLCEKEEISFTHDFNPIYESSFFWTINDTLFSENLNPSFIFSTGGYKPISLKVVNDSLLCNSVVYDTILINNKPLINAGENQFVCEGDSIILNAFGGVFYDWGDGFQDDSTYTFIADSTKIIQLKSIDDKECEGFDDVLIFVKPNPDFSILGDTTFCQGQPIKFYTQDNSMVYWNDDIYSNEFINFSDSSFILNVLKVNYNNCKINKSIYVEMFDTSKIELLINDTICYGDEIKVDFLNNGSLINNYNWKINGLDFNLNSNEYLGNNKVSLICENIHGCISRKNQNIFIRNLPNSNFIQKNKDLSNISLNAVFEVENENYTEYNWSFGDNSYSHNINPNHLYDISGQYEVTLTVKDKFFCKSTSSLRLDIISKLNLWIPNSFTPNNDGLDDMFYIVSQENNFNDFQLKIFNKWGDNIFTSYDINKGWSGKNHFQGVYLYLLSITDLNGKNHVYKGEINLIK